MQAFLHLRYKHQKTHRPFDVQYLRGDYSKAKKKLGWKPKTKFKKLVKIMIEEDISRWERWQKGEHFPWGCWYVWRRLIRYLQKEKIIEFKLNSSCF